MHRLEKKDMDFFAPHLTPTASQIAVHISEKEEEKKSSAKRICVCVCC